MIRNEIVEEVVAKRDTNEVPITGTATKDNYLEPIPTVDITLNPNLEQNPYY